MRHDQIPRRSVPELISLYKYEPQIRDVFVEGSTDRSLYSWFLHTIGARDVVVREIRDVAVTEQYLQKHGLSPGCRSEVVALAYELCGALQLPAFQVTCIIDKDFGEPDPPVCEILLMTDYTSVELYCYDTVVLDKYLALGLSGFPHTGERILASITEVLYTLFAIRHVNQLPKYRVSLLRIDRSLTISRDKVEFDLRDYTRRMLLAAGRGSEIEAFLATCAQVRAAFTLENRNHIHGHDFVSVLTMYLKKVRGSLKDLTEDIVRGGLVTSLELQWIEQFPLFVKLAVRVRS
jgi:hypothetical protein